MPDALNLFPARVPWGVVDLPGVNGGAPTRGQVTLTQEAFRALNLLQSRVGGTSSNIPLNTVLAGPASGNPGFPTFRSLVAADLPAAVAGAQAKNLVYAGPASGANAVPAFRGLVNADLPASSLASCQITKAAGQAITSAAFNVIVFDTVITNVGACYTVPFNAFSPVPGVAGLYLILFSVQVQTPAFATTNVIASIFLNGVEALRCFWRTDVLASRAIQASGFGLVAMNGASDFIQINVYQDSGANATVNPGSGATYFQAFRIA